MPIMGRRQADVEVNTNTNSAGSAADATVSGHSEGWNPAANEVASTSFTGDSGGGNTPVTPEPEPVTPTRRETPKTAEKKEAEKPAVAAPSQFTDYYEMPTWEEMEDTTPQQPGGVENLSNEVQSGGMVYDDSFRKRKQQQPMNQWTEDETYEAAKQAYGTQFMRDPQKALGVWADWLKQNPQAHKNVKPANLARKQYARHWSHTHPNGNYESDRWGDANRWLNGGGHFADYEDEWIGKEGYELPEKQKRVFREQGEKGATQERQPSRAPEFAPVNHNVEFLTNERNTAIDPETGEILENQSMPSPVESSWIDEVPTSASTDQVQFAKWLTEYREGRLDTKAKIRATLKETNPEYYAALEAYESGQTLEENDAFTLLESRQSKDIEYQDFVIKDYLVGHLNVEGQHLEQVPGVGVRVKHDPEIEVKRMAFASIAGLDPVRDSAVIDRWVRLAMNFTKDNEGKMYDQKRDPNAPMFKSAYISALECMGASWKKYGHPFGFTEMNKSNHNGSTDIRFPVGVVTAEDAEYIARATGLSASQVIDNARIDSLETYKIVSKYAARTGDMQMLHAWENQTRAMCRLAGYSPTDYGVPIVGDHGFGAEVVANELFKDFMGGRDETIIKSADERTDRAFERIKRQKISRGARMVDGKLTQGKVDSWSQSFISLISTIHIVGDIRLLLSGLAEHGLGNLESRLASFIETAGKDQYKKTDWLAQFGKDAMQAERVKAAQLLFRAGQGFDMVQAFADAELDWTLQNAQKFILEGSPEVEPSKLKKAQQFVSDKSETLMTGGFSFETGDSKTFLSCLLGEMAFTNGLTAEEIEQGFKTDPDKFMSFLMKQDSGKQAVVAMTNQYAARISPASEAVQTILRSHGVTNGALSVILGSPFITYGVRAFELFTPFSNTLSWYVTRKATRSQVAATGNADIRENQIGGITEDGWKKALLFDSIKIGQNATLIMVFAAAIAMCGGIEPPDDEDKYLLPWEWKIHVPWSEQPIPFKQSWFMDDLFQWSTPLVMSLCYLSQTQDAAGAAQMFCYGFDDIFGTNKVVKCIKALADLPGTIANLAGIAGDPTNAALNAALGIADYITSPMGIYQFQDTLRADELQRDSRYYLDENGKEVYRGNDMERMYAAKAENNGLLALLGNCYSFLHGTGFNRFGWSNEGYEYDPDERDVALAEANSYQAYLANTGIGDSDDAKKMYGEYIYNRILEYADITEAAKNGFIIDQEDAQLVKEYIFSRLDSVSDNITELKKAHAAGAYKGQSDLYWSTKDGFDADKSELYKVLDAMAYDGIIFDKKAYRVEVGTTVKDMNGERYNYGDHQTWLNPFTSPETDNDYFREVHAVDTDLEWDEGDFRTESYRNDGTTAYQRHDVPNTESSFIKEFQDEYKAKKEELQKKEQEASNSTAGTTNTTAYGGNGGGNSYSSRSYSSGGGGGSSANYSPKIYNMKGGSLSVNKPASMYTKTPYSANKSYLSPDFQTAGSRNAYKRSEY